MYHVCPSYEVNLNVYGRIPSRVIFTVICIDACIKINEKSTNIRNQIALCKYGPNTFSLHGDARAPIVTRLRAFPAEAGCYVRLHQILSQ